MPPKDNLCILPKYQIVNRNLGFRMSYFLQHLPVSERYLNESYQCNSEMGAPFFAPGFVGLIKIVQFCDG